MNDELQPATPAPVDPHPFNAAYVRAMNQADQDGPASEPADAEAPPPETPAVPPEAPSEPPPVEPAKGKGNPRHDPKARVAQATAEAAEAKREATELKARIAALEAERQTTPKEPARPAPRRGDDEPKEEEFADQPDPYAAYVRALGRWEGKQAARQTLAEERAREAYVTAERAHATRFQKAIADDPDLPEMFAAVDAALIQAGFPAQAPVPAVMMDAIKASEMGPEISRFLGSHPEELVQLARDVFDTPRSAATVVRRLLEAAVKTSSPAPTAAISTGSAAALPRPSAQPITPVRTSRDPAPERDPSELSFGRDYVRRMNAKERRGA